MNVNNLNGNVKIRSNELIIIEGERGSGKSEQANSLYDMYVSKDKNVLLLDGINSKHSRVSKSDEMIRGNIELLFIGVNYDTVIYVDNDETVVITNMNPNSVTRNFRVNLNG